MNHFLVVHCKKEPHDVYIGRPSPFGNPFSHLPATKTVAKYRCKTREESIQRYEEWLRAQPELMAKVRSELKGKILGCWCAPKACHGDILARIANNE